MIDPRTVKEQDLQAHGYAIGFTTVKCGSCKREFPFLHPEAIRCFDCAIKSLEETQGKDRA